MTLLRVGGGARLLCDPSPRVTLSVQYLKRRMGPRCFPPHTQNLCFYRCQVPSMCLPGAERSGATLQGVGLAAPGRSGASILSNLSSRFYMKMGRGEPSHWRADLEWPERPDLSEARP